MPQQNNSAIAVAEELANLIKADRVAAMHIPKFLSENDLYDLFGIESHGTAMQNQETIAELVKRIADLEIKNTGHPLEDALEHVFNRLSIGQILKYHRTRKLPV